MAGPQIVNTLRAKRDELERIISSYETATTAARRDLAPTRRWRLSVAALNRPQGSKRGEIFELCKIALYRI
jgi:hypothetical protein